MKFPTSLWLLLIAFASSCAGAEYGVDCSFPIHDTTLHCGDLLGDRQAIYDKYMQGCREKYDTSYCDDSDEDRIDMNYRQPQSIKNFTAGGFKKVRAPQALYEMLTEFWEKNQHKMELENSDEASIFMNHWSSPSYMVYVTDPANEGGGEELGNAVWAAAKQGIEEWTNLQLRASSLYGIRVYTEGAVLNPHVDRIPLISSAIVNVAQDVDEDWPLEVYDRFGHAVNITMQPGDMVFYESASLIHGRPFPLKGRYYANIFIHFEPVDAREGEFEIDEESRFPPYLIPGSPWAETWVESNTIGWSKVFTQNELERVLEYAYNGDLEQLKEMVEADEKIVHYADREEGWQPLQAAVWSGHTEVASYLIEKGADVNALTQWGEGQSSLSVAYEMLGKEHPICALLASHGAEDIAPLEDVEDDEEEENEEEEEEEDVEEEDGKVNDEL